MSNKPKNKIYCYYYKDTFVPVNNNLYVPVMAGNAHYQSRLNIQGDDEGDSISEKNSSFSELTGIYWAWKNTKQEITGSCHYRRYFTAQPEPWDLRIKRSFYYLGGLYKKRYGLIYTNNVNRFTRRILTGSEIQAIFKNYDAILPQKRKLKYSVETHFSRYHDSKDLHLLEKIIGSNYPDYLPAFNKVMKSKRLYANNMFLLPEIHYQQFMAWWFSILFEFEKQIKPGVYKGYQQRIIGFIAERLLTVWFCHKELKVKELPVIYFKRLKKEGS